MSINDPPIEEKQWPSIFPSISAHNLTHEKFLRPAKQMEIFDETVRALAADSRSRLTKREARKVIVGLLELDALNGVEAVLAARLNALLVDGKMPDLRG